MHVKSSEIYTCYSHAAGPHLVDSRGVVEGTVHVRPHLAVPLAAIEYLGKQALREGCHARHALEDHVLDHVPAPHEGMNEGLDF